MRRREDGFTLVELLVVMVVIGVLSAIALPSFAAQTKKSKTAALKSALRSAQLVEEQRATDERAYAVPGDVGLAELVADGFVPSASVRLTVVAGGSRYCLRAHHVSLSDADDLYLASDGPHAGRASEVPCS